MARAKIILAPVVSEKTVYLGQENRYAFWVKKEAVKPEISRAVEEAFKVDVTAVHIINVPGKRKRFRGIRGQRQERKKAIVTLKKGQKINLFEEAK